MELRSDARKALGRMARTDRERVQSAIDALPAGDVRRPIGAPAQWRARVGDWRIRFRLDWETRVIDVLNISPRGDAYKRR